MTLNYYSTINYSGNRSPLNKARGSLIFPGRTNDGSVNVYAEIAADILPFNATIAGLISIYAVYWNAHFAIDAFPSATISQFNSFPTKYKFGSYNWTDGSSFREGGFIAFVNQYTNTQYYVHELNFGGFVQSPITSPVGRVDAFNVSSVDRVPFTGSGDSKAEVGQVASGITYALSAGVNATIGISYHVMRMYDNIGSTLSTRGMQI